MRVIIDGSYIAYRSQSPFFQKLGYVANNGTWVSTGVIFSVVRDLLYLLERHKENKVVEWSVVWDKKPTERLKLSPKYKEHRRKGMTPSERRGYLSLKRQMKELRKIYHVLGFSQYWMDGYEADDVMATLALKSRVMVELIATDKDMYQVLTSKVVMYNFKDYRDDNWFRKEYGLEPIKWIDVQSLTGDTADNIDGIKGVGVKTACKLLQKFEDPVEAVIGLGLGETEIKKVKLAKKLVTLDTNLKPEKRVGEFDLWLLRKYLVVKRMRKFLESIETFRGYQL